jgi:hypothetical protein
MCIWRLLSDALLSVQIEERGLSGTKALTGTPFFVNLRLTGGRICGPYKSQREPLAKALDLQAVHDCKNV